MSLNNLTNHGFGIILFMLGKCLFCVQIHMVLLQVELSMNQNAQANMIGRL